MTINLICLGKIKEPALKSLIFEYEKRISKFAKLITIELKDLASDDVASDTEKSQVIEEEGRLVLSKIQTRDYVIALALEGVKMNSEQLAVAMNKGFMLGGSQVTFVIGGSLGLSEAVKKRANLLLSFSDFTFPHQLMRLILLEQVYRTFKINNNEPYHK